MPAAVTIQPPPVIARAGSRQLSRPADWAMTRNGMFMNSQDSPVRRAVHPSTSLRDAHCQQGQPFPPCGIPARPGVNGRSFPGIVDDADSDITPPSRGDLVWPDSNRLITAF
jgi:hypothetical protein